MTLKSKLSAALKIKNYKVKKTYTFNPEIVNAFEKYCDSKNYKYSQVLEKLMLEILK